MLRTQLYADPAGVFVHDLILRACQRFPSHVAIVDTSTGKEPAAFRRIAYAEYGDLVTRAARGMVAAGLQPGEVVAIYLPNSWEFAVSYHAATLAGGVPTPLNPSYREREVRYQLECSGAAFLITDGPQVREMNLSGLPQLRRVYSTRMLSQGAEPFDDLISATSQALPEPLSSAKETLAALPFSSGTTGMPKGVMLSHSNLVTNVFQLLIPGETASFREHEVALCFLPLYHIYGLNVVLNPVLTVGGTVVLMPRFDAGRACGLIASEAITFLPLVPPVMNAFCEAAGLGLFPRDHKVRAVKSGAAPLPAGLPHRFSSLTGIPVRQGYGMTEASPVTHMGFLEKQFYRPESIGHPLVGTECKLVTDSGAEAGSDEPGELVMRGSQFMQGYWKAPQATAEVMRDGWYWSGDVARRDTEGFYFVVDRRKEMIKYKGFPVAPAEVEAVLMEHAAVLDCGVIGRPDNHCGEIPVAFIVLRPASAGSEKLKGELAAFVAERITSYKQPREVRFVSSIPRNPSGKVLRRELRAVL